MKYKYYDILEDIISPTIASFIVILNSIVIYYIIKYRNTQHNPIAMVYMLNMAFGDFFVGIIMIIMKIFDVVLKSHGISDTMKDSSYHIFRNGLIRLSLFISVLNLIPLTIDRVWAVKYPISHRQSKKALAIKICIGVWTISIVFVTVFYCLIHFNFKETERFNKLIFPVATYPTTLVFIVSYSIIFRQLRISRRYRERTGSRSFTRTQSISNQLSAESRTNSVISLSKFHEKKNEVRFLHLAIKTVVIFVVCWFPIATCGLADIFTCNKDIEATFVIFGYLNAAITPLVYYSHLRLALKNKLRRLTSRKQPRSASACTTYTSETDSSRSRNASFVIGGVIGGVIVEKGVYTLNRSS